MHCLVYAPFSTSSCESDLNLAQWKQIPAFLYAWSAIYNEWKDTGVNSDSAARFAAYLNEI